MVLCGTHPCPSFKCGLTKPRLKLGMNEYLHPVCYIDVIIYPCPVLGAGLARSWWLHQMETFSALLALSAGNSPVPGEFPTQRPVTRSSDVFFDLRLNKRLSKQSWDWWSKKPSRPLWRHRNGSLWISSLYRYQNITLIKACEKLCRDHPYYYFDLGQHYIYTHRELWIQNGGICAFREMNLNSNCINLSNDVPIKCLTRVFEGP